MPYNDFDCSAEIRDGIVQDAVLCNKFWIFHGSINKSLWLFVAEHSMQ